MLEVDVSELVFGDDMMKIGEDFGAGGIEC